MGGSDMIEATALGKFTIFGPHTFNFRQTVDSLLAGNGAVVVNNGDELLKAIQECFLKPNFARYIAQSGQDVIRKNQGATARSIEQIGNLLNTK
jgi:3-deoxy-D-manno-octulosonic-acid transferase